MSIRTGLTLSVILQQLEFYSGLLILITNRVEVFDETAMSHIHLALHFPNLAYQAKRKILNHALGQVGLRYGLCVREVHILDFAQHYLQDSMWNGRHIQNACQSAALLALHDSKDRKDTYIPELAEHHFEMIFNTSKELNQYRTATHVQDELRPRSSSHEASPLAANDPSQHSIPSPEQSREGLKVLRADDDDGGDDDSELEELQLEQRLLNIKVRRKQKSRMIKDSGPH